MEQLIQEAKILKLEGKEIIDYDKEQQPFEWEESLNSQKWEKQQEAREDEVTRTGSRKIGKMTWGRKKAETTRTHQALLPMREQLLFLIIRFQNFFN